MRLSKGQREAQPYCQDCAAEGHMVIATQSHHVHKRSEGGALLSAVLISLCASHHSRRTQRGE